MKQSTDLKSPAPSMILLHQEIQNFLNQATSPSQAQTQALIQEIFIFSKRNDSTLDSVIEDLKQRTPSTQGRYFLTTLEVFLVAWAVQHRAVTQAYAYELLKSCLEQAIQIQNRLKPAESQLILCARYLAKQRWKNQDYAEIFAHLARYPTLAEGVEIFAQMLYEQTHPDLAKPYLKIRPLPRKLLLATLYWPEQDKVFPKVIRAIESQPLLERQIREYATSFTEQTRLLKVKESLLLVGPKASRELILVAHFEADLTRPYFPLRALVLQKHAFMADFISRLSQELELELPCHESLLVYLWLYDFWYHPELNQAVEWQHSTTPPTHIALGFALSTAYQPIRALRLIKYWQLPEELIPLVRPSRKIEGMQAHPAQKQLILCTQLTQLACAILFKTGGITPEKWQTTVQERLSALSLTEEKFVNLISESAFKVQSFHPLTNLRL